MSEVSKFFRLGADEIVDLARGRGSCYETDRITVDGLQVGYCYREEPDEPGDSGWRFFSGDETQDYVNSAENSAIYDVNTIANYDPDILSFVDVAAPVRFEREGSDGPFRRVSD